MGKVMISGGVALLVGLVWLAIVSEREWQRFAAANHCVAIHHQTEMYWQTYSDGKTTMLLPIYYDHVNYRCDDGEHTHDE